MRWRERRYSCTIHARLNQGRAGKLEKWPQIPSSVEHRSNFKYSSTPICPWKTVKLKSFPAFVCGVFFIWNKISPNNWERCSLPSSSSPMCAISCSSFRYISHIRPTCWLRSNKSSWLMQSASYQRKEPSKSSTPGRSSGPLRPFHHSTRLVRNFN